MPIYLPKFDPYEGFRTGIQNAMVGLGTYLGKRWKQKAVQEDLSGLMGMLQARKVGDTDITQEDLVNSLLQMKMPEARATGATLLKQMGLIGPEELYELAPGEKLVTAKGKERARGVPQVSATKVDYKTLSLADKLAMGIDSKDAPKMVIQRDDMGELHFKHVPDSVKKGKNYVKVGPYDVLVDPTTGGVVARGKGKSWEQMSDKDIGIELEKWQRLKAELGLPGGVVKPERLIMLKYMAPEIYQRYVTGDIDAGVGYVDAQIKYLTELRYVRRNVKGARFDPEKGVWYVIRKGKRREFTIDWSEGR